MKFSLSGQTLDGAFNSLSLESFLLTVSAAGASAWVFGFIVSSGQDLEFHYVICLLFLAGVFSASQTSANWVRTQRVLQFSFCELLAIYTLYLSLSLYPGKELPICGASAALTLIYCRAAFHWTQSQLILLLVKQVTFWCLAGEPDMAISLIWAAPLLLAVYVAVSGAERNKVQIDCEGHSLKHFLDRLYCGVLILRDDEILCANSALTRFFHTSDFGEIHRKFKKVPGLNMKLRRFMRQKDEWSHFGTFPLEDKLFEWIGCKIAESTGFTLAIICRESREKDAGDEKVTKSELIRSMSHDLKTPINCIMHMSEELISAAEMPSSGGQKCQVISSYCHFMSYLINDMVDYSELVSGERIALRRTKVHLCQLVRSCVEMVSVFAEVKQLKIEYSVDANLPEYIITDQSRLTQVILNLLSNAIKYTLKGTIKVVIMSASNRKMKVLIEDSGIGMYPEQIPTLFQGSRGGKTLPTAGIGLVLANAIAQELGFEDIKVTSEVGHGTNFSFCVYTQELFPCEATPYLAPISPMMDVGGLDRHQCAPVFQTSGFIKCREGRGADILLVDDYPFNRMIIKTILDKEGLSVHEAENGQVAIEIIRKQYDQHRHYRLILMDIDMPVLDGIKTTEKLIAMQMSDPEFVLPPIVGHSAFTSDADIEKFLSVGMQGFIPKPFIKTTAMELIWKLMLPSCRKS